MTRFNGCFFGLSNFFASCEQQENPACAASPFRNACRRMGTERHLVAARERALEVKRALRGQVGECLTYSIDILPQRLSRQGRLRPAKSGQAGGHHQGRLPGILLGPSAANLRHPRTEQRPRRDGILTVAELWNTTPVQPRRLWDGINGELCCQ